jgi:hypothetical protein
MNSYLQRPCYCGIGDLKSVALETQTSYFEFFGSLRSWGFFTAFQFVLPITTDPNV